MKFRFKNVGDTGMDFSIESDVVSSLYNRLKPEYVDDIKSVDIGVVILERVLGYLSDNPSGVMISKLLKAFSTLSDKGCLSNNRSVLGFTLRYLTGDMFNSDTLGLFKSVYGTTPSLYRKSVLGNTLVEISSYVDYLKTRGLGDVVLRDLRVAQSTHFLRYSCTVSELVDVLSQELDNGGCILKHFLMIRDNIKVVVDFVKLVDAV